jgi:predicted cupin superfamily sugar epimerase
LRLEISEDGGDVRSVTLGADLAAGQEAQGLVPPKAWQTARSLGEWTLVGCTVVPAFLIEHFELAPPGWSPGRQGR